MTSKNILIAIFIACILVFSVPAFAAPTGNFFADFFNSILSFFSKIFSGGPTGFQTVCGTETVNSGTNGEVKTIVQSGGTESSANCPPSSCGSGFVDAGIFTDKYRNSGNTQDKFAYSRICAKGTSGNLKTCTSTGITGEGSLCTPSACDAGYTSLGTFGDLRELTTPGDTWTWNEVNYRICVSGIDAGSSTYAGEGAGSFPASGLCTAGQSKVGDLHQIHFDEAGQYRTLTLCVAYTPPTTTSTPTTTVPPTTTSSSSTTTSLPGGTTSSSTTTSSGSTSSSITMPPTTSAGSTSSSSTTTKTGGTTTTTRAGATTTTSLGTTTTTTIVELIAVSDQEAYATISETNKTIVELQATKNISEALKLYGLAVDAYNTGDYANAKTLALQAQSSITELSLPAPAEIPILYVSIGGIVLLVAIVGIAFYLQKQKKAGMKTSTAPAINPAPKPPATKAKS